MRENPMEPNAKKVKFNLNDETIVITLDGDEPETNNSQDLDNQGQLNPSTNSSQKIILRSSLDCEEEIAGNTSEESVDNEEVMEDDVEIVFSATDSDHGANALDLDLEKRAKSIAGETEGTEIYKKSCQQYSFINPLSHGEREDTLPCPFRLEGCSYASDNIRTAVHIHSCDYRPVTCTESEECGQIPFTKYIEHIRNNHEATGMVSKRRWWYHEQFLTDIRLPIYIRQYDGQTFLLNTQICQSKAHWWMTMHGELEKIGNYCISVKLVPRLDRKNEDNFLRSSDLDVYLSRQAMVNDIPVSNFGVTLDELYDYCYTKLKDKKKVNYWRIKVTIKRRKPKSNLALFTMRKVIKIGSKYV